jgi:hypothetical protein
MVKEDSVNWPDLKKILEKTDKKELITLIRDLYKRSAMTAGSLLPGIWMH